MKTASYNPSVIEVDFANALHMLSEQIQKHLQHNTITHVETQLNSDNPLLKFSLIDNEGDPHEVVVKIIQIPDKF